MIQYLEVTIEGTLSKEIMMLRLVYKTAPLTT